MVLILMLLHEEWRTKSMLTWTTQYYNYLPSLYENENLSGLNILTKCDWIICLVSQSNHKSIILIIKEIMVLNSDFA